jgi:hypothetical protein
MLEDSVNVERNINGDSYSFGKAKDGSYISIISDGMGSGPRAGQERQSFNRTY